MGDALGLGWIVDLNGDFLDVNTFPALGYQQFQFGFITAREQSHGAKLAKLVEAEAALGVREPLAGLDFEPEIREPVRESVPAWHIFVS